MKKIIAIIFVVLIIGTTIFLNVRPFNNKFVMNIDANEYEKDLINALEEEDYKLASNLVYSIANSKHEDYLIQLMLDARYFGVEPFSEYYSFYRGLIDLLQYIDINDNSTFELKQADTLHLSLYNIVYFEYELDGVAGYYVNYPIHGGFGSEWVYDRINASVDRQECTGVLFKKDFCDELIFLDMANDMYYSDNDYGIFKTNIDYTLVMVDYKNVNQEPIVNYRSLEEFDDLASTANDLHKIFDSDTSQEERDELQNELIEQAHENGNIAYGDANGDDLFNSEDKLDSGVNAFVNMTYNSVNSNGELDDFIENIYIKSEGTLDMNSLVDDYYYYRNIFNVIRNAFY